MPFFIIPNYKLLFTFLIKFYIYIFKSSTEVELSLPSQVDLVNIGTILSSGLQVHVELCRSEFAHIPFLQLLIKVLVYHLHIVAIRRVRITRTVPAAMVHEEVFPFKGILSAAMFKEVRIVLPDVLRHRIGALHLYPFFLCNGMQS